MFTADLGEVLAGRSAVDYRDLAVFFGKTYLTKGLAEELLPKPEPVGGGSTTTTGETLPGQETVGSSATMLPTRFRHPAR